MWYSVVLYIFLLQGGGGIVVGEVKAENCEEAIVLVTQAAMAAGQMPDPKEIKRAVPTCESLSI